MPDGGLLLLLLWTLSQLTFRIYARQGKVGWGWERLIMRAVGRVGVSSLKVNT